MAGIGAVTYTVTIGIARSREHILPQVLWNATADAVPTLRGMSRQTRLLASESRFCGTPSYRRRSEGVVSWRQPRGPGRTHNLSNRRRLIWVIGLSAGCSINSQRCSRDFRSRPDTAHRQRPTCTFARTCRRPAARIVNRAMAVPNPQPSTLPQASPLPLLSLTPTPNPIWSQRHHPLQFPHAPTASSPNPHSDESL